MLHIFADAFLTATMLERRRGARACRSGVWERRIDARSRRRTDRR